MAPKDAPLPSLSFDTLDSDSDRRDAMALVADSIAQQRQVTSLAIIFHPLCLASLIAVCSFVWLRNADLGTSLTAVCGLVMAYLAAVRLLTSRFIALAEQFRWRDFLILPDTDDGSHDTPCDEVIAARFGSELIGTLVLRIVPPPSGATSSTESESPPPNTGSGLIRAWTTKLRYRNRGVGADLLRFAVVATRSVCGDTAPVSFAPDHANAQVPLPYIFARPFRTRDQRASKALDHALDDYDHGIQSFEKNIALAT